MSPAPRASIISPDGGPATVETGRNRNGSRPIIRNGKYLHKRGESVGRGPPRRSRLPERPRGRPTAKTAHHPVRAP
jgi:hypothetical protein